MRISEESKKVLLDTLDNLGIEYRSYSGRAMYGDQCLGIEFDRDGSAVSIVCDILSQLHNDSINQFGSESDSNDDPFEDIASALKGARHDSMGLGSIVYWPRIAFTREDMINRDMLESEECDE